MSEWGMIFFLQKNKIIFFYLCGQAANPPHPIVSPHGVDCGLCGMDQSG